MSMPFSRCIFIYKVDKQNKLFSWKHEKLEPKPLDN